jgi:DNA-binding XRE family transcriptional regulator
MERELSSERLRLILLELQTSKNALAKKLETSSQALQQIESGKSGITPNIAKKIIAQYPQFNYEWLVQGTGEMLNSGQSQNNNDIHHITGDYNFSQQQNCKNNVEFFKEYHKILDTHQQQMTKLMDTHQQNAIHLMDTHHQQMDKIIKNIEKKDELFEKMLNLLIGKTK